jgi:hypothetical protein
LSTTRLRKLTVVFDSTGLRAVKVLLVFGLLSPLFRLMIWMFLKLYRLRSIIYMSYSGVNSVILLFRLDIQTTLKTSEDEV